MSIKTTSKRGIRAKRKASAGSRNGHTVRKPRPRTRRAEPAQKKKSVFAEIDEIVRHIPPEVLEAIPKDLSINLDHYLYGVPKVEPWRPV